MTWTNPVWLRACTSANEVLAHISVRNMAAFWERRDREGQVGEVSFY